MTAAFQTGHVTVYQGDALAVLRELPAESVDCCVTSPPYWGLRDYGTAKWEGGSADCDHMSEMVVPLTGNDPGLRKSTLNNAKNGGNQTITAGAKAKAMYRSTCGKCGARRIDAQLGLEPTPDEYVQKMVEVFREVRRVLSDRGTLWLNLGDSYAGSTMGGGPASSSTLVGTHHTERAGARFSGKPRALDGLKPKDMVGIPWRVAFALQADGWYLRSDIIWAKPNPMPESVTDRPTKSHEYVFLLSKSERYFYDADAIAEPTNWPDGSWARSKAYDGDKTGMLRSFFGEGRRWEGGETRNARTVWTIATQPYPEAHFATFPRELPERCIKAGCPEQVCSTCGKARERVVSVSPMEIARSERTHDRGQTRASGTVTKPREAETTGWTDCGHNAYVPGVVLDPFAGSGTTLAVARDLGRKSIGIELNPQYVKLIERRCAQTALEFTA